MSDNAWCILLAVSGFAWAFGGFVAGVRAGRKSEVRAINLECDRLKHLLSGHDICECGMTRAGHKYAYYNKCKKFQLADPADPLETIVEDE